MSKAINKHVAAFIAANPAAYKGAAKVFAAIESQSFTQQLAECGVMGHDVKPFAVIYVAETSGVMPHDYRGSLVFAKGSSEANRVNYLVRVVNGQAEKAAAKRKESPSVELTAAQEKAVASVLKAFGGDVKAVKAALAAK
jgi:hypothetical protein